MSAIGSVSAPLAGFPLRQLEGPLAQPAVAPLTDGVKLAQPTQGFDQMLDGLVGTVDAKQAHASDLTRRVLLGESDQLHQSVIAMQEAGVAFTLMVEVRNKLVESYQELMRMQV